MPLRLGVDEAGTAVFTQVLGLGSQTGVTLAIVRKARMLFWAGAGARAARASKGCADRGSRSVAD